MQTDRSTNKQTDKVSDLHQELANRQTDDLCLLRQRIGEHTDKQETARQYKIFQGQGALPSEVSETQYQSTPQNASPIWQSIPKFPVGRYIAISLMLLTLLKTQYARHLHTRHYYSSKFKGTVKVLLLLLLKIIVVLHYFAEWTVNRGSWNCHVIKMYSYCQKQAYMNEWAKRILNDQMSQNYESQSANHFRP